MRVKTYKTRDKMAWYNAKACKRLNYGNGGNLRSHFDYWEKYTDGKRPSKDSGYVITVENVGHVVAWGIVYRDRDDPARREYFVELFVERWCRKWGLGRDIVRQAQRLVGKKNLNNFKHNKTATKFFDRLGI